MSKSAAVASATKKTPVRQINYLTFVPMAIVVILTAILAIVAVRGIEDQTRYNLATALEAVLKTAQAGVRAWKSELRADIESLGRSRELRRVTSRLLSQNRKTEAAFRRQLDEILLPYLKSHGHAGYGVIDLQGNLLLSNEISPEQRDLVVNAQEAQSRSDHTATFELVGPLITKTKTGGMEVFLLAVLPVRNSLGNAVGSLILFLDAGKALTEVLRLGRIGRTGETYALSRSGEMITESRFAEKHSPQTHQNAPLKTEPAKSIIAQKDGYNLRGYPDYRGVEVVGAWTWDNELGFGLVTEIDKHDAYETLFLIRNLAFFLLSLFALSSILLLLLEHARRVSQTRVMMVEEKTQARQEMLASVSHDLKNPLTAILINIDVLIRTLPKHPDLSYRKEILERIARAGKQMQILIDDLLASAKLESGTFLVQPQKYFVHDLLNEINLMLLPLAKEKNLNFAVDCPSDCPPLHVDPIRTLQIFSNIIGNAIKFTPPQGEIVVHCRRSGHAVRFTVSDSGPGISQEHISKVFERYWQAEDTKKLGTGLGLSITRELVSRQGGKIWVESKKGAGTSFHIELPVWQEQQDTQAA